MATPQSARHRTANPAEAELPATPLTASDYLAMADREFAAGNALSGAERLWDAAALTLKTVAQEPSRRTRAGLYRRMTCVRSWNGWGRGMSRCSICW